MVFIQMGIKLCYINLCVLLFPPFPGPGTGPIRLVSKFRAVLMYLCVQNFDVVFTDNSD